jgi:hypothetical protein
MPGAVLTRLEVQAAFRALLTPVGDLHITRWERSPTVAVPGPRVAEVEFSTPLGAAQTASAVERSVTS